jgi:NADPH-dependent 2,4-dienoyl-CoA reductase/sulfur reductase-like enzyme
MNHPVVIVGASMGGLRTAESLRRFGYLGPITVIGEEIHKPYNRPPLSKDVLANEVTHEAVAFEERAATADVNWVLGTRAVSADFEHKPAKKAHTAKADLTVISPDISGTKTFVKVSTCFYN